MSEKGTRVYEIGRHRLVPRFHKLFENDTPINVGEKIFRVLSFLVENRDRALSKDEILNEVWGKDRPNSDHSLVNSISALRAILGQKSIENIPGYGYRFIAPVRDLEDSASSEHQVPAVAVPIGTAPPLPDSFVGREEALQDLKERLGKKVASTGDVRLQVLTAVRGWPGVGKTTLAAAIAHDRELSSLFIDGMLWVSLGQRPKRLSKLASWGRALGISEVANANDEDEASSLLRAHLRNRRMLVIIDDVWESEDATFFKIGGRECATLITTRISSVADDLAPTANDVYWLPALSEENALLLLETLAPEVVSRHPNESRELVRDLEGLPLAIHVAGLHLKAEAKIGIDISDFIADLRSGAEILASKPPANMVTLITETTPTVAALFRKSTDVLDSHANVCFARLGAFASKPATFDLQAMAHVWRVEDPKPIARLLADRGLIEPVGPSRFQMHSLLVSHAKALLSQKGPSRANSR